MTAKKVLILGEIGVGKTSLVRRLVLDEMTAEYIPTMGVDIYRYSVPPSGSRRPHSIELVIWDIDGNYGQSIFKHVYSKGASGALIVGDVSRRPTLDLMVRLAHGFQDTMPGRHFSFVLNKLDLVPAADAVMLPEGLASARQTLLWTSAKSGENVRQAFEWTADAIVRREL